MPDAEDIRFGQLALQARFITRQELELAVEHQREQAAKGAVSRIGETLMELGFITRSQAQRLLVTQEAAAAKVTRVGHYELLAKLGQGGMGAVYKATDTRSGASVAIKILPRSKAQDREFLRRFEDEFRSTFELDHPNIVKALDIGEADGYHYFAMEYVDGADVYELLETRGRLEEADALSITIQVVQAMDYAQGERLLHRDIKPDNILVDADGFAKLADFGLAKDYVFKDFRRITVDGSAIGTPMYISPEQARGGQEIDIRSDIYSLGATLYEMVTGKPPFEGETPAEVLMKHMNEEIISPRDIDRTLSDGLCQIIEKMMAKSREDRYQTPKELLRDLMLVYSGRLPASPKIPAGRSSVKRSVRPAPVPGAAGAVAAKPMPGPARSPLPGRLPTPLGSDGVPDPELAEPRPAEARPRARRSSVSSSSSRGRIRERRVVAIAAVAIAIALLALAIVIFRYPRGPGAERIPGIDSGETPEKVGSGRFALVSDFGAGSALGWTGEVTSGPGGKRCLSLAWAGVDEGFARVSRASRMDFIGSGDVVVKVEYRCRLDGPLVVRLRDRTAGRDVEVREESPRRSAWTSVSWKGSEFVDSSSGAKVGIEAGHVYSGPAVYAGLADADGDVFLAGVAISGDSTPGWEPMPPSVPSMKILVQGREVEVRRWNSAYEQLSLASQQNFPHARAAGYLAVGRFFPLSEAERARGEIRAAGTFSEELAEPERARRLLVGVRERYGEVDSGFIGAKADLELARLKTLAGRHAEALGDLERLSSDRSRHVEIASEALYLKARSLARLGRKDPAADAFREILRRFPGQDKLCESARAQLLYLTGRQD